MKVVHVLKKIETIDQDVKELKKLEKSIAKNKSFSTPIYMSIEKQINILLGERIKLLELRIENPPEGVSEEEIDAEPEEKPRKKAVKPKKSEAQETVRTKSRVLIKNKEQDDDDDDIPMMTQDDIDARFEKMQKDAQSKKAEEAKAAERPITEDVTEETKTEKKESNDDVKLLDIALEKGTINKKAVSREKEKKVRFFRENFPSD